MMTYLEFEKPIEVLDNKIHELKSLNENAPSDSLLTEIQTIENNINDEYKKNIFFYNSLAKNISCKTS